MKVPTKVPLKGFYYHYKHDPSKSVNNYAYEFLGVGCHTEDNCDPQDANMAIYRPLYEEASVFKAGKFFDLRPLDMWVDNITKDGKTFPRFKHITDPEIIRQLEIIKNKYYQ